MTMMTRTTILAAMPALARLDSRAVIET